jgi:hypothetical protein
MTNLLLWGPDLTELDRLAIAFAVRRKGKLTRFDSLDAAASSSEIPLLCRGFVIVALFEAVRSYGPSARETLRKLSQPPRTTRPHGEKITVESAGGDDWATAVARGAGTLALVL